GGTSCRRDTLPHPAEQRWHAEVAPSSSQRAFAHSPSPVALLPCLFRVPPSAERQSCPAGIYGGLIEQSGWENRRPCQKWFARFRDGEGLPPCNVQTLSNQVGLAGRW